ncbi:MAG: hypothetical protein ACYSWP_14830 [Planctomycetota bacterium]
MRSWRGKMIFMFIVYFAGFATAIYCLSPAPEKPLSGRSASSSGLISSKIADNFDSEQFARSFNSGMHKALDIGKDMAVRTGKFIKQKIEEKRAES